MHCKNSKMTAAKAPPPTPPVPAHKTPLPALNISIIQPQRYNLGIDPATTKHLGQRQQSKKSKIESYYDSSTATSTDESEEEDKISFQSVASEEHKFWQVHSSTTIIAPPLSFTGSNHDDLIKMTFVKPHLLKKQQQKQCISLAKQVQDILGSVMDNVDEEIEREWENSRIQLKNH